MNRELFSAGFEDILSIKKRSSGVTDLRCNSSYGMSYGALSGSCL